MYICAQVLPIAKFSTADDDQIKRKQNNAHDDVGYYGYYRPIMGRLSSFLLKSTNFSSMEMTSDDQEILFRLIDPKTIYSIIPERQFVFLMYFSHVPQHPSTPTGMALR